MRYAAECSPSETFCLPLLGPNFRTNFKKRIDFCPWTSCYGGEGLFLEICVEKSICESSLKEPLKKLINFINYRGT